MSSKDEAIRRKKAQQKKSDELLGILNTDTSNKEHEIPKTSKESRSTVETESKLKTESTNLKSDDFVKDTQEAIGKNNSWLWYLIPVIILSSYFYFSSDNSTEEQLSKESVESKLSLGNTVTTSSLPSSSSSTITTQSKSNLLFLKGYAKNINYEPDWPILYSMELLITDNYVVEVLVDSENLSKFTYVFENGCDFQYVSGQKSRNKTVKKLIPKINNCEEKSFSSTATPISGSKILLEGNGNIIEIDLSNSEVLFPGEKRSVCCTSLSFYNIHAALISAINNIKRDSTTTTVPQITQYEDCKENVDNATATFRYYEEDISNNFNTWSENINIYSEKEQSGEITQSEYANQYFKYKNIVSNSLQSGSTKVSSLPQPIENSLYGRYYKRVLQVKSYAEEYFEVYVLYYEKRELTRDETSARYGRILDKWVAAEVAFRQLSECN